LSIHKYSSFVFQYVDSNIAANNINQINKYIACLFFSYVSNNSINNAKLEKIVDINVIHFFAQISLFIFNADRLTKENIIRNQALAIIDIELKLIVFAIKIDNHQTINTHS
jgi:hypothetical protein